MRDYRGKRLDNGEWIEGWYQPEVDVGGYHCGVTLACKNSEGWLDDYEVDPATAGQYTGLPDQNGVKIYEGDIVEPVLTGGTYMGFSWGRQVVIFDRGAFCLKDRRGQVTPLRSYAANVKFKVWGNVHDNPELLEVTE